MNLLHDVIDEGHKNCKICAERKFVRKPFKPVTNRVSELLELIHTNLEDFKNLES